MANSNYRRGRAFEYEIAEAFRANGFDVTRTAGSHGAFDLWCVNPTNGFVQAIQCKVVQTEAEAKRMLKKFREHPPYRLAKFHQTLQVKVLNVGVFGVTV